MLCCCLDLDQLRIRREQINLPTESLRRIAASEEVTARVQENIMTESKFSAPPDACNPLVRFSFTRRCGALENLRLPSCQWVRLSFPVMHWRALVPSVSKKNKKNRLVRFSQLSTVSDPKQSRRRRFPKINSSTEVTQRSNPNSLRGDIRCKSEAMCIFLSMSIPLPLVSYFKRSRRRCCSQISYNTHRAQRKCWDSLPGDMQCKIVALYEFLSMRIPLSIVSDFKRSSRRCCSKITYNPHRAQRNCWDYLSCDVQAKVLKVCDLRCMAVFLLRASYLKRVRRQRYPKISSSTEETQRTNWHSLPEDMQHKILAGLPLPQVFQFQSVSKSFVDIRKRPTFLQSRLQRYPSEGKFSPMVFFIDPKSGWHWLGFDLNAGVWKRLPSLSFLATPDADLFKEFSVAGSGGLLCVNVSKQPGVEQIIICNPLTGAMRKLPPMNHPRQPVVMNLFLDKDTHNYKVIVAGSAMIGSEELSRKTEVYDSITGEWKVAGDVPGPEYALNEFQTGALSEGVLYCIGFISTGERITHGLLAYHVETEKWIHDWECTLPRLPCCQHVASNTTQLFESEGSIFVYWEQEHSRTLVHFCVAKLEISALSPSQPTMWSVVVSESRVGTRGLLVYPEYLGIGHGHGKVCIFNTLELTGCVYKIGGGITVSQQSPLEPMPTSLLRLGGSTTNSSEIVVNDGFEEPTTGANGKPLFFPLNTLTFTFQPSFNTPVL